MPIFTQQVQVFFIYSLTKLSEGERKWLTQEILDGPKDLSLLGNCSKGPLKDLIYDYVPKISPILYLPQSARTVRSWQQLSLDTAGDS